MNIKKLLSVALLGVAASLQASEYYVAPSLVPTGTGTISAPWDLQTALHSPSGVKPGDTIWVRGGVHRRSFLNAAGAKVAMSTKFDSTLLGTAAAPIIVRAYPGEQPTIDGNLQQKSGGYVTFWGLEIMDSLPGRYSPQPGPWPTDWWITQDGKQADFCVSGVDIGGNPDQGAAWVPGMKFINCIVHDNIGGGFGLSRSSAGILTYGCLVYYNGWRGYNTATAVSQNHGHGYYIQHAGTDQTIVKNCFSYQNFAQGSQYYGTTAGYTDYGTYDGLIEWQNSHFQAQQQRNMEYGNGAGVASLYPTIANCMVYDSRGSGSDSEFGDGSGLNHGTFKNNYFGSPVNFNGALLDTVVTGNSFMAGVSGTINSGNVASYPGNTFGWAQPATGTKISVYPNEYEAGRGNIVIFNWGKASTMTVDVSTVGLKAGDQYELHQADDYFKDITYGTYAGTPITINMTGHTVAQPVGYDANSNPEKAVVTQPSTFPVFGAFVIMKKGGSTGTGSTGGTGGTTSNTAPTISSINAQTIPAGGSSGSVAFTVGDAQTAPASLTVSAASSNPTLVPNANIVLGGAGTNRTMTITPAPGQSGSTLVTLTVSDGTASASSSFSVNIVPGLPIISKIPNQTVAMNNPLGPIAFTATSAQTPTATLNVTATCSSQTLVPNANIKIGGSGTNRTLSLTPATGQSGVSTITVNAVDGASAASTSFQLTVTSGTSTNAPGTGTTNPPSASVVISFEAESGAIVAPMTVVTDPKLAARKYIQTTAANAGTATYKVTIPKADTYIMWCKVLATNYTCDSVFVSVDGTEDVYDMAEGKQSPDWQWTQVTGRAGTGTPDLLNPRTFTLAQGTHTIVIRGREVGAAIDRIILCNDPSYVPAEIVAKNDTVSALPTGVTQIDPAELLANDTTLFGDTLKVNAVGPAQNGTVALASNMINYTPKAGFSGQDTFPYTVTNGMGGSAIGAVAVNVGAATSVRLGFEAESGILVKPMTVVTNPQSATSKYIWTTVANQGSATYNLDIPKAGAYSLWCRVLATSYTNDSFVVSVDGTEDIFDVAEGTQSTNWQWTVLNGRGTTGVPKGLNPRILNFTQGTHSIIVRGREACTALDQLVITDDPAYVPKDIVAAPDSVAAVANAPTSIAANDLMRNDFSAFGEPFQIKSVGTAQNGTVVLTNGSITYTPKAGFVGTDTFTYTISDALGNSATGTVTVTVK